MTYIYSVNNAPTTGPIAMYQLISLLVSAGWIKKSDSDGTTYSSAGTQVTSGNSGTGGLGNNYAWVRMQAPPVNNGTVVNQTREITLQRATSDTYWRIKYSASAGFIGGTPTATATPSAADEVFMLGGGTDASPTSYTFFNPNGSYYWHIVCGGVNERYSFLAWGATVGAATTP